MADDEQALLLRLKNENAELKAQSTEHKRYPQLVLLAVLPVMVLSDVHNCTSCAAGRF